MAERKRSAEDIRQDITKEQENISQTVGQISERVTDKLDWRAHVRNSPFWALGAAAGLGYVASTVFSKRTTPSERLIHALGEEVRGSLGGILAGAAGPGLIKLALLGIATKAAVGWIRDATSAGEATDDIRPQPQTGHDTTITP